jgi:hypothetical protein
MEVECCGIVDLPAPFDFGGREMLSVMVKLGDSLSDVVWARARKHRLVTNTVRMRMEKAEWNLAMGRNAKKLMINSRNRPWCRTFRIPLEPVSMSKLLARRCLCAKVTVVRSIVQKDTLNKRGFRTVPY